MIVLGPAVLITAKHRNQIDHRPGLLAGRHVRVAVPLHDPGRRSPVRLRILKFLPARTCLQLAATLYIPRGMGG